MSNQPKTPAGSNFVGGMILISMLYWGLLSFGGAQLNPSFAPIPTFLTILFGIIVLNFVVALLRRVAGIADWMQARTPTGLRGTSAWAKDKDLIPHLTSRRKGLFWGVLAKTQTPLFFNFVSNSMIIAASGSGKGICFVVNAIMAIRDSKFIVDFKGELYVMLADALRKKGQDVYILNPGHVFGEKDQEFDTYNPLDIIVDSLHTEGGLRDIPDDLRELSFQIYEEPESSKSEDGYFRSGSRDDIQTAIIIFAIVDEYDATFESVSGLLNDPEEYDRHLAWILGIDEKGVIVPGSAMDISQASWASIHDLEDVKDFAKWLKKRAKTHYDLRHGEGRAYESFITGARQNAAPFDFGRLAPAMRRSTFSMNVLKDKKSATVFVVSDASRPETYKAYVGLIQWCALAAMKRHSKKSKAVYFICDEATNYLIHGLGSLLTWGRSYGIRLTLIFQSMSAFETAYSRKVLNTLMSETEIKFFLPGQREPDTLSAVSKMLGEESVMSSSTTQRNLDSGLSSSISEQGKPLKTPNQIRESNHGYLIVRNSKPMEVEPVSYAEISPWRRQVRNNPFFGKRFKKPVKLRFWF